MRSVGVEEELLLVDPTTGAPTAIAAAALRSQAGTGTGGGSMDAELQQQQLEVDTAPTVDLADLAAQIRHWRAAADHAAASVGARIAALATSPLMVAPTTTVKPRYLRMVEHFGLTTTEQLTCGCHVHVSVESPEEGVAVLDRIRVWLPALLALSANSPYWQGQDSGYASFRSQTWARFPSAGPAGTFGSPAGYRAAVGALIDSGVVLDEAMVYFDARLSARYPTVEVRVADVCVRPEDTVAVAALTRALVETAARQWRAEEPAPTVSTALLRMATWRAGRSGLTGELVHPVSGRPAPAAEVVTALQDHVAAALEDSGDAGPVTAAVRRLMEEGTGADLQRAVFKTTGDLAAVVRAMVEVTGA